MARLHSTQLHPHLLHSAHLAPPKSDSVKSQLISVPVKQPSAWIGVARSDVRVLGEGGPGGSCGARGSVGGDGCSVRGWGDGGHGAGIRAAGPACAGEGAGGGDRPAPAVTTSSPSCDPWSSCCHSTCPPDGGRGRLSVSEEKMRGKVCINVMTSMFGGFHVKWLNLVS